MLPPSPAAKRSLTETDFVKLHYFVSFYPERTVVLKHLEGAVIPNCMDSEIELHVRCDNIDELPELIPNVECLVLCVEDVLKLTPLTRLTKLISLKVVGLGCKHRLYGLKWLVRQIPDLTVYDVRLKIDNPLYPWPRVKAKHFKHIDNIRLLGPILVYDVICTDSVRKELKLSEETVESDNVLIQVVSDHYYLVYHDTEANRSNDTNIEEMSKKQFEKVIRLYNKEAIIPKCVDDLWRDDSDDE